MNKLNSVFPHSSKAGYSLVEVTLALLVVAIGLTSTFALFPEAMKNTRTAVSDTEVGLFADYVFSTLAVGAAKNWEFENKQTPTANFLFDIADVDKFASRALSRDDFEKIELDDSGNLTRFYWIPEDDSQGTGSDWTVTRKAGFWTTAFSYKLTYNKRRKGNNRDTIYATLKVWPGEWENISDEKTFKPYVFYREIILYPNL